ncbi:MAG: GlcNAc-PI de-N-acetylase [Ruminococcaceae bacterium]|nr:GlcNAc-PI de-N-acetylase [Oscillospiraceae bacterium]
MKNILVVGAHFDDAELGCGGTMAKLASEGKNVYKLTLTDNVTNFEQMNIHVDMQSSQIDSANACKEMNVQEICDFEMIKCNELVYSTEVMQRVEKIIFNKEIDTVFIHYDSDMNQDHIAASKICLTAARHCKNILYYQSNGYILDKAFYPTVFFDISDHYEAKKKALNHYRGDHNRFDRLFDISLKRTEIWGYANKVKYAEGFVPVKISL